MLNQYADVAIPKPIDQTFQYQIPDDLLGQAEIGKRVRVPFGRQIVHGYIVNLTHQAAVEKIKPIIDVIDSEPVIHAELMKLSQWMSSYYLAFPGLALKMILTPQLIKPRIRSAYQLNFPFDQIEEEIKKLKRASRQAEILRLFLKNKTDRWNANWGGQAICKALVLKKLLREIKEEVFRNPYEEPVAAAIKPDLTEEQAGILQKINGAIEKSQFFAFLLYGITGSGKTEIYLRALEHNFKQGKEGLLVVPEISLTPQIIRQVKGRFGSKVAVIHSGLSTGERSDTWKRIKNREFPVVVGVRSSIFAPFHRLGLLIIDEEHDTAYKQDSEVKYHARDTAIVRAKELGAVIIMGSATPSLESYFNSQTGKSECARLTRRVGGRPLPAVRIINMRETPMVLKEGGISQPLHQAILERLKRKEQILLFLNRRGFSPFLLCYECGFSLKCKNCSVSLTFHKKTGYFHCHYCNHTSHPLDSCPQCQGTRLAYLGRGTEKTEEELIQLYPGARIKRMDRDTTTRRFSHDHILAQMRRQEIDILIGTQMITKGHDLPQITLVGVLCADTILNLPDFRSAEKTFQILTQVSGRAGRGEREGEVLIQTYNPDHYSIAYARDQDYLGFYQKEILFRKELNYPPFSRLVSFLLSGANEKKLEKKINEFENLVNSYKSSSIEILGPAPAPLFKLNGRYRWRCLVKGKETRKIQSLAREVYRKWSEVKREGVRLDIDIDPQNLM